MACLYASVRIFTPFTENVVLSTVGLETCARICRSRNARFAQHKTLGQLIFRNKTVNDCQGWSYTLCISTCFLAEAWETHKFITGMDYNSLIGKVAVTGRPHCVSNLDNLEPLLQVNGTLIPATKNCEFSKTHLVFSEIVNFR